MAYVMEIVWETFGNLLIRDSPVKWNSRVTDFMVERYFRNDRVLKHMNVAGDPEEEATFRIIVRDILLDECSIVAVDKDTDEIHAVALLKWLTEEWRSWIALKVDCKTPNFSEVFDLVRSMIDEYKVLHPSRPADSLHVFYFHIDDKLRAQPEFVQKFFFAIFETGRHMKMPRVTLAALSVAHQQLAEEGGLVEILRFIYSVHIVHGRRPFERLRDIDEMHGALYEKRLVPVRPYSEMPGYEPRAPEIRSRTVMMF